MDSIVVAASQNPDTARALDEICAALPTDASMVLVFHSINHDPEQMARCMAAAFPNVPTMGCTTMGEVGPAGLTSGGISALAIRGPLRAAAKKIASSVTFEQGRAIVAELARSLGISTLYPDRHLFLLFADGLSRAEERLVASLGLAAPGIPLVGGSAGDDFRMAHTAVWLNGEAQVGAHLVVLLEPQRPFGVMHVHHYRPTERRVVVTGADPEQRRIWEIDGWPVWRVLMDLLRVDRAALRADPELVTKRSIQFAYQVGSEFFLRSMMRFEGESLQMAGAVDEGSVLRIMEGADLVDRTRAGVAETIAHLRAPAAGALVFNCGGRLFEAKSLGLETELYAAMAQIPSAGFSTYGEQLNGLHVNHTLTGIVLGAP